LNKPTFIIKPYGNASLLVEWDYAIHPEITFQVQALYNYLSLERSLSIIELVPAYQSLLIIFQAEKINSKSIIDKITSFSPDINASYPDVTIWNIPVLYDKPDCPDIQALLHYTQLDYHTMIHKHMDTIYDVNFIGFLPGFLYLSGMDPSLTMPRKKVPDLYMPKGSVAIGGMQTGIYPEQSPGGWHRIGQVDIDLFDPYQEPYCKVKPGDRIRFTEI